MSVSFAAAVLFGTPMIFMGSFKRFINFDPARHTIEAVS